MKRKLIRYAAAAVFIFAVGTGIVGIVNNGATPAYAIEQTLEALDQITTVHMYGNGWDGKKFEIWMTLDPDSGVPDHVYLDIPEHQYIAVSTPTISYQYNKLRNSVSIKDGSLINFDLNFERMLENAIKALAQVEGQDTVRIYTEINSETGKNSIVIHTNNVKNEWKFYIDPETKLPVSMFCVRSDRPGEFIKNADHIYFDEVLPEKIFDFQIPEGALVRDQNQELKLLDNPSYGISTEGLTTDEAVVAIAEEYWQALMDFDLDRLEKVYPIVGTYSKEQFEDRYQRIFDKSNPLELVEVGQAYVEHGCGLGLVTPCILRFEDDSLKEVKIITRFREIEGKPSCVIAGQFGLPRTVE